MTEEQIVELVNKWLEQRNAGYNYCETIVDDGILTCEANNPIINEWTRTISFKIPEKILETDDENIIREFVDKSMTQAFKDWAYDEEDMYKNIAWACDIDLDMDTIKDIVSKTNHYSHGQAMIEEMTY